MVTMVVVVVAAVVVMFGKGFGKAIVLDFHGCIKTIDSISN